MSNLAEGRRVQVSQNEEANPQVSTDSLTKCKTMLGDIVGKYNRWCTG